MYQEIPRTHAAVRKLEVLNCVKKTMLSLQSSRGDDSIYEGKMPCSALMFTPANCSRLTILGRAPIVGPGIKIDTAAGTGTLAG